MDALPFSPGEFDVIWAEGSIYNIGFERGLREWRQYLKPGRHNRRDRVLVALGRTPGRRNSSRTISPTSTARRGKCGSSKRRDMHRWRISRCPSIAGRKTTSPMQAHASRDSSSNTGTVKKHSCWPKCRKTRSPITKNQSVLRLRLLHRPKTGRVIPRPERQNPASFGEAGFVFPVRGKYPVIPSRCRRASSRGPG